MASIFEVLLLIRQLLITCQNDRNSVCNNIVLSRSIVRVLVNFEIQYQNFRKYNIS